MNPTTQLAELCQQVRALISTASARGALSEAEFNEAALNIFSFQIQFNQPYQRICLHQGKTPDTVRIYREIPSVITSSFKEIELTALPPEERTSVFYSSGTTAQNRSRHFHNQATLDLYTESLLAWFKPFVLPDSDSARFLILTPPRADVPHSSLVHMFEELSLSYGNETWQAAPIDYPGFAATSAPDGSWNLNSQMISRLSREQFSKGSPVVICGTAFSFVHLCDHLQETRERLTFPPGSRVFETGGYKGRSRTVPKEELHRMIEDRLQVPATHIISEYGMSELSSQAYDRIAGNDAPRLFQFPPWVRWEIISPETGRLAREGETGLVRIYDLANVGSVLAVQTEDLATQYEGGFVLQGRASAAEARGCSLMNP